MTTKTDREIGLYRDGAKVVSVKYEPLRANARVVARNQKRDREDDAETCVLCAAPLTGGEPEWFVLFDGGYLVTDLEGDVGLNIYHRGYMATFPAGPRCAKKIQRALAIAKKGATA
jgi:hypothetical protein